MGLIFLKRGDDDELIFLSVFCFRFESALVLKYLLYSLRDGGGMFITLSLEQHKSIQQTYRMHTLSQTPGSFLLVYV